MVEFHIVANAALTLEQQRVFERLASTTSGLHVICGTLGSGKSFLIRYYVLHLVAQNKMAILCASTGAATTGSYDMAEWDCNHCTLPIQDPCT